MRGPRFPSSRASGPGATKQGCPRGWPRPYRLAASLAAVTTTGGLALAPLTPPPANAAPAHEPASASGTVWLCRPGAAPDPCTAPLTTTVVDASGAREVLHGSASPGASKFDCFYVYPTVSLESATNANLTVQATETAVAVLQASRFSQVCQVWAPMYRQVTWAGLTEVNATGSFASVGAADLVAYESIKSGLEDYLAHYNDGRPIVFIGHSQGAAMLILLLEHLVDNDPALRGRLVMAIILGGNVQVPTGRTVGGSFQHIPLCTATSQDGCVIAYSSFPGPPPAGSLFGRPGRGVSLQSGQTESAGYQVACVNPAVIAGGTAELEPYFLTDGKLPTPWVNFPGLYKASCEHGDGATWLDVTKATGPPDLRPVVTEALGPDWGYHVVDVNLALGNLIDDVEAAEATWSAQH
ncbi:MAG TPA: DUF3089 domain-containing protein [Acidimicrobiales bacterium]|nr:DUF3089 domain-containing protein [Acidimicrobiales bacterium]